MNLRHVAAFIFMLATSISAQAQNENVPIVPDGQWREFFWEAGAMLPFETDDIFDVESPPSSIRIDITDIGTSGDRFRVFLDDLELGDTSESTEIGQDTASFDVGFMSPIWSSGSFEVVGLTAGTHEIRIQVTEIAPAQPDGLGGIRLFNIVPEPSSFGPAIMAALVGCLWRRRT